MVRRATLALLVACAAAACGEAPAPRYDLHPVVLVHGSGMGAGSWARFVDHLVDAGYPPAYVHAVSIVPADMSNVRAAEDVIAPAVEELLGEAARHAEAAGFAPPSEVDLIGHSMGAFSTRWYAARIAPERVRTWIGLAGANHGSDALSGYGGAGNEEMLPAFSTDEGGVQAALNGTPAAPRDETPHGTAPDRLPVETVAPHGDRRILYVTYRIDPDRWIVPARSAALDGCGGPGLPPEAGDGLVETSPGNFLLQAGGDHDRLMDARPVREHVLRVLTRSRD